MKNLELAKQCEEDAIRSKREFTQLKWVSAILCCLCFSFSIISFIYKGYFTGLLMLAASAWCFHGIILCRKKAEKFFNSFMKHREDFLDLAKRYRDYGLEE